MGSINSQGVYEYDVTDDEIGPVLLNRQSAALTNLFQGRANTVRVANVSERAAALADHGTPSTSNPLIVFRADAGEGRELEYTTNGTLWHTLDANGPEDTGWVAVPGSGPSGWTQESQFRIKNGFVTFEIRLIAASSSPGGTISDVIPADPQWANTASNNFRFLTYLSNETCTARVFTNGRVNVYATPAMSSGTPLYGTFTLPVG